MKLYIVVPRIVVPRQAPFKAGRWTGINKTKMRERRSAPAKTQALETAMEQFLKADANNNTAQEWLTLRGGRAS